MGRIRVRYLIARRKPRKTIYYWWPVRKLQKAGFTPRRLSDDLHEAVRQAQVLNAGLDAWRAGVDVGPVKGGPGTVAWLIADYQAKDERFLGLAPESQRVYRICLGKIDDWAGEEVVPSVTRRAIREWYRSMASTPSMRNLTLSVLRRLLQYATDEGLIETNPALKPDMQGVAPRQTLWSPEAVGAFCNAAIEAGRHSLALAVNLALATAQREGDLIRLTWAQYVEGSIRLRQQKTGRLVSVPLLRETRAMLDREKRGVQILISEATGAAYSSGLFRREFRRIADAARLDTLRFHDLRRTAMVRLGEAGCTAAEITAISGHDIQASTKILETYLPRTAKMAAAAIVKLGISQRKRNKS